ncbi:N-acetylmuramic acid 6-phosphate etherase [Streptomyces sp. NPDC002917]|jgi:N-acetylmuramic acid 6-phosphate etherase|uniref:N-acetylmuramic acid 6-phosphate etherase n=1 Tax=unclassified Streptomyces TaxID=2593676 RepID=UPI002DD97789|nr:MULTISPECIES: N-acetylmuramic acid 6-phosphate etherase [unclassified Streptomyces]WTC80464.1 N-acetylmuramic acid 6-phosphate etherase [Streptomyces sp. NBC_01653]WTD34996.1 N-acetylmuramic acid 6-phosphate etherase [Streptomyces sp. NBC_01643]WTD90403.1 N-acetylmuramic acid 6-phosphate etherase [Streptomyces sp. NBC_01637]WSA69754.1 N-acetylmuramic acid 6-phosphate etherase [Streptomyces sp. NBC_01800]WUC21379.1 N-acetylmuramic acid 6-phosphate etherase [Streptomyces sp. NBC_00562]
MTSTTDANAATPGRDSEYGELRAELATLTTEAFRPELAEIDRLDTLEIARIMNGEDRTVPTAVAARLPEIAAAIDGTAARMARGGRLIYAGAGTPGRLGILDASECPPTFNTDPSEVIGLIAGGPSAIITAVEGAEDSKELAAADLDALDLTPDDTVVGISASGRTPYAIGAVEHARAKGALTIGLSCNADSALGAAAEHPVEIVVGPELLTGSTRLKAGTAQKLVLNMLSTITMIRLGKTYGNLMVDVRASNEKLRARSRRIVALATGASDEEIEAALAATDGEVKNAILTILGQVDGPTAATLLSASDGHLRAALAAAPRTTT